MAGFNLLIVLHRNVDDNYLVAGTPGVLSEVPSWRGAEPLVSVNWLEPLISIAWLEPLICMVWLEPHLFSEIVLLVTTLLHVLVRLDVEWDLRLDDALVSMRTTPLPHGGVYWLHINTFQPMPGTCTILGLFFHWNI